MGERPEVPTFYLDLFNIMTDPAEASIARALRHLDKVRQEQIDVIRVLPEGWRQPGLVRKLHTYRDARSFVRSVSLIRRWCPAATDEALNASIAAIANEGSIAVFVARWVRRVEFARGPIADNARIKLIKNGHELHRLARSMRNCLRDQIDEILARTASFYLIDGLGEPVVVRFLRPTPAHQWTYDDAYLRHNAKVEPDLRRAVEDILERNGIDTLPDGDATSADIKALREYLWAARYSSFEEDDLLPI